MYYIFIGKNPRRALQQCSVRAPKHAKRAAIVFLSVIEMKNKKTKNCTALLYCTELCFITVK